MATQTVSREVTAQRYGSDKPRTARVILTIDWDEIFRLIGEKAIYNKTGRARMLKGALVAHVVKS